MFIYRPGDLEGTGLQQAGLVGADTPCCLFQAAGSGGVDVAALWPHFPSGVIYVMLSVLT